MISRSKKNAEEMMRRQNEARRQKIIQELYGKKGFARERII